MQITRGRSPLRLSHWRLPGPQADNQDLQRCHHAAKGLFIYVSDSLCLLFIGQLGESRLTSRTKLSLSHALAQSVKISLFEELISSTIEQTKDIPKTLSETGKIGLPRSEIMKQIGNLFILRININLVGSILDSPVS